MTAMHDKAPTVQVARPILEDCIAHVLADLKTRLVDLPYIEWRFSARMTTALGTCRTIPFVGGSGQGFRHLIKLSTVLALAGNEDQADDTIRHEIAHALTPGHGHDIHWKAAAVRVGAKPVRCYKTADLAQAVRRKERPKTRHVWICPNHGELFLMPRFSPASVGKKYSRIFCRQCRETLTFDRTITDY